MWRLLPDAEAAEDAIQHIIHPNAAGDSAKGVGRGAEGFGAEDRLRGVGGVAQGTLGVGEGGAMAGVGQQGWFARAGGGVGPGGEPVTQGGHAGAGGGRDGQGAGWKIRVREVALVEEQEVGRGVGGRRVAENLVHRLGAGGATVGRRRWRH